MKITDGSLLIVDVLKTFIKEGKDLFKRVKKEYQPILEELKKRLEENDLELNIYGEEIERVTLAHLVEISKTYMVEGANEVVVLKRQESDATILYLCYAKDKELLKKEDNKYIIVKTKRLSDEVYDLFTESELVILN